MSSIVRALGAAALLILLTLAAGCTSPPEAPVDDGETVAPFPPFVPPEPTFDFATVIEPDHAHNVPTLHEVGHGLSLTGHAAIQDILPVGTRGSITQVDVWGDYAVVSGMEGGLAFAIVDITDPASPKAISWYPSTADGWTARFSDDGDFVFYGCQTLGVLNPQSSVQGSCTDPSLTNVHEPGAEGNGIIAVNVTDKAEPKFAAFIQVAGSHNLQTANINGTDYVFTEATEIVAFDRTTNTLSVVATVSGVHDATAQRHAVTGDWLLYTGSGELSIYNINDPSDPRPVYEGAGGEGWTGWHEQTPVPGLVDGRVLLVLAGESFAKIPSEGSRNDVVAILNITDPSQPELLGTWTLPMQSQLPWVSYTFSAHEIAATPTGQVAIAWYHGGVWVIDVSTQERQQNPVTLAAYQPHELPNVLPSTFVQTPMPMVPFVWGTGWTSEGYLVVPDMHTGLYVMTPDWGLIPGSDGGQ